MIYCELPLPSALAQVAFCAWEFVMEAGDPPAVAHQVPPDGTTNLVLIVPPGGPPVTLMIGPALAAAAVPVMQGFRYAGLRLRPEWSRAVAGADPQPNGTTYEQVDGQFAAVWRDLIALLDGGTDWCGTLDWASNLPAADLPIMEAVDRLVASGGTLPIRQVAGLSGLSERQFRRRFLALTGVAPKQYADVQRVRRALILSLDDSDWAGIAFDAGFADQPHLARDIKGRFGAGPRCVRGYFEGIRHELLDVSCVRNLQAAATQAA